MAIEHDGISCPLPKRPVRLLIGVVGLVGAGWLWSTGMTGGALGLALVAPLFLINELGRRRVKIIASRLLVEDEHLLGMLLLGPVRHRVEWSEFKSARIEGRSLHVDTTKGPFVTAQGAEPAELEHLLKKIATARAAAAAPPLDIPPARPR